MKNFRNKNIQKENKFMIKKLVAFLLVIAIAFLFKVWENKIINKTDETITDLNSIILSQGERSDKKAYLDIKSIPYQFAVADGIEESFYIVTDGEYLYIAYMGSTDFEKLNNENIKENPIRVTGITNVIKQDVKKLALEVYNESVDDEYKISMEEFNDYFGDIYLNMAQATTNDANIAYVLFIIFLIFGLIGFIIVMNQFINFKRNIGKIDAGLIEELDEEMNSSNAFYYDKAHMYLTNRYIINFKGKFFVIDYKDIVWMYPYKHRTNGIKTSQSIKVMTNEGKTYTIATIEFITKAKKEVYDEIWNTIVSKNGQIALGYTKENIQTMKDRFKKK